MLAKLKLPMHGAALPLLLICCALGCAKSKKYTRTSDTARAPAGAPFARATASIDFRPSRSSGHGTSSARVTLKLLLEGGTGREEMTLETVNEPRGLPFSKPKPGEVSRASYKRMLKPDFDLRFSPDGQALALSVDGGKTFRKVAFDAGEPLYCSHETFSLKQGWSAAPSTRKLVLDILASTDPPTEKGTLHLRPTTSIGVHGRFDSEFRVASLHACAHLDDAELRRAVVKSLVQPGWQLHGTLSDLAHCVGRAASKFPQERSLLLDALKKGTPMQQARAGLALGEIAEPAVQQVLASALRAQTAACAKDKAVCLPVGQASLLWSLARVSTALKQLPAEARDVVLEMSHESHPALQVYAIRALAVSKEERVLQRLGEMSDAQCSKPLPAWTDEFENFPILGARKEDPACWAQAALKRGGEKRDAQ